MASFFNKLLGWSWIIVNQRFRNSKSRVRIPPITVFRIKQVKYGEAERTHQEFERLRCMAYARVNPYLMVPQHDYGLANRKQPHRDCQESDSPIGASFSHN